MIDIIALIYLCRKIGKLAQRKGLKPGQWKFITVITWIVFEIAGVIICFMLFGFNKDNILGFMAFAVVCAFGGYLIVKANLDKRPDPVDEDDINNLGVDN